MHRLEALSRHPLSQRIYRGYRRLFSVQEIEHNVTLQWLFGAMLLFFFVTFYQWIDASFTTKEAYTVCWPYFLGCNQLHFLSYFPYGYSQTIFYIGLFIMMLGIAYSMYQKWWTGAHALMFLLWIWKFLVSFVLAYNSAGVYDYYHLLITATLLFVPHKEYFAKLMFVMLYFLSSTIKFYPTWTLGTYFTSLKLGLPIFPDALTPLITNFVILEQVVGAWFLLSRNKVAQRLTLGYAILFHLYGGVFVLYNYTIMSLSTLLILFGPRYRHQYPPLMKTAIAGWVMILIAVLFQTPVHFIPGDEKITMEGYRFGMWMFDANHQCAATYSIYYDKSASPTPSSFAAKPGVGCGAQTCVTKDETAKVNGQWVRTLRVESPRAEVRCSPYTYWQRYIQLCDKKHVERVAFTFDHAINGGPFYRIVDVPDMCGLTYSTWSHNSWIQEPPQAPAIGLSVENSYF